MLNTSFRKFENLHIVLWLVKDFCWVTDFKVLGMLMIVPTISVAIFLTIKTWSISSEKYHNLAVVFWIFANSIWMFGEFYLNDTTRPISIVFFILGLLTVGYHYVFNEPFWKQNKKLPESK